MAATEKLKYTRLIHFVWEIPFTDPEYSKMKNKIELPHILGANCVNFWRVCGFNSSVQFVFVVVLLLFFSISLVSVNLLTDS